MVHTCPTGSLLRALHLLVPDGGHGDDRHVQGIQKRPAQQEYVTRCIERGDSDESQTGQTDLPQGVAWPVASPGVAFLPRAGYPDSAMERIIPAA
jgi:hypothetical protein